MLFCEFLPVLNTFGIHYFFILSFQVFGASSILLHVHISD